MSRSLKKRMWLAIGWGGGILVVFALCAPLLLDLNHYKKRLESSASDALGMDVRIGGRLGMGLFPGFHVTVEDVRLIGDQGTAVASARKIRLWIALLPLLRKEVRLSRVELMHPRLSIERGPEGTLNVGRLKAAALLAALDGATVSLSDGTLDYADLKSGAAFEASDCDLAVSRMRLGRAPRSLKGLSLRGKLTCGAIKTKTFTVSGVSASVEGTNGVFDLGPVTMRIFGGQAVGNLRADFSGEVPLYRAHGSLPSFRIEEFLEVLSPKKAVSGAMNFSASLTMKGKTGRELVQSMMGTISLRGDHLSLAGHDLDAEISRFASTQSFNLVDVGAIFFAGPLGLAVTKGYGFASLFQGAGGSSTIETLVSDWRVERGIAWADDVAMASARNRIALRGGLDFVNERFADVTFAVVDARGCASARQVIRGSFEKPIVEKPRILRSLAAPWVRLYTKTRGLFPQGPCEAFYSGSVASPT
jgi:AsmA protein